MIFCMDVGGTRTKYGLVDLATGRMPVNLAWPTEVSGVYAFAGAAEAALEELCQRAGFPRERIMGAGLGIPGYVNDDFISMVWESLAFMEGNQFRPAMAERLGCPVRMDNDARVVALGEALLGGHGRPGRLLSLTLGTGLGFGLVINGELQEKTSINHLSGHIPIRPGARPCFCGFSGCLESLVGNQALVDYFKEQCRQYPEINCEVDPEPQQILEAAGRGDPLAEPAARQLIEDLITGLNAYILLFGPDVIALGGGLAEGLSPWLDHIQQGLFAHPYQGYQVQVRLSRLGKQAGLFGAAALWNELTQDRLSF